MPLFDQLRGFLAEVQGEKKAAAQKKAGTLSEPGSVGGETSHPVKNVDDQLQSATEGARSSENSSDVKSHIPLNVDSASDKGPDQESQQFNIGVTSTETGNDSANEHNYKDKKDDPGTTHPASVDDNEKYGSMKFEELKKLSEKKANDILATVAAAGQKAAATRPIRAAPAMAPAAANLAQKAPANPAQKAPAYRSQKAAATRAAAAGYQAAADAGVTGDEQEKQAVQAAVEGTIREALAAAVMTGNYLVEFHKQALNKKAADDEDGSSSSSDSEGGEESESKSDSGGGDYGGGGGGGGGGLGLDPAALGAMAGGGGGDPMADAGGGGGQEDAVNQLLMALMEMGVSPDEIMAALQGGGGGGMPPDMGGGMPPDMGGGMPPDMGGGMPPDMGGGDPMKMARVKQAQQVRNNLVTLVKTAKAYQRQGKFRFSEAKTAAERRLRDELKKCIAEIVN